MQYATHYANVLTDKVVTHCALLTSFLHFNQWTGLETPLLIHLNHPPHNESILKMDTHVI